MLRVPFVIIEALLFKVSVTLKAAKDGFFGLNKLRLLNTEPEAGIDCLKPRVDWISGSLGRPIDLI